MIIKDSDWINEILFETDDDFHYTPETQKRKLAEWIYESYKNFYQRNGKVPDKKDDLEVLTPVFENAREAEIDIPEYEIRNYYCRRKIRLRRKLRDDLENQFI